MYPASRYNILLSTSECEQLSPSVANLDAANYFGTSDGSNYVVVSTTVGNSMNNTLNDLQGIPARYVQ